ncbi:MAG: LytTR family DNA-binding domain-containing protein [Bacteroidota bacterium]
MTALILDDESDAREVLSELIQMFCPEISDIHQAKNGSQAISLLKTHQIHLAFIDIELRAESGLELAQKIITYCPHLIFVTAHAKYAVKAFQTPVTHYLVKPVIPEELQQAVDRVKANYTDIPDNFTRLLLPSKTSMTVLDMDEIIHIQGEGNYCHFFCIEEQQYFASRNLSYYEKLVDPKLFYRTHQSHLVNINFIRSYGSEDGPMVQLKNGKTLPLSQNKKRGLLHALQNK